MGGRQETESPAARAFQREVGDLGLARVKERKDGFVYVVTCLTCTRHDGRDRWSTHENPRPGEKLVQVNHRDAALRRWAVHLARAHEQI